MIKICGLTRAEDLRVAVEEGADTLGFNFWPKSPRFLSTEKAERLLREVPDAIAAVGVLVVPEFAERGTIEGMARRLPARIDVVQLHGLQSAGQIPGLLQPVLVACTPPEARRYPDHEIIIDASWGQGKRADWEEILGLRRSFILAGGLNPENVADAIRTLKPAGVDVCSGVETRAGRKDPDKLRSFLRTAGRAFAEIKSEQSADAGRNHTRKA